MTPAPSIPRDVAALRTGGGYLCAFQWLVFMLLGAQAVLLWAVYQEWFWLAVPMVLVASHLMHGVLIGFHEASHGLLRKNRRLNEFDGVVIGMLSLTSFSLYRALHQTHHAFLSTERDEEFWPFVSPKYPRWLRVMAAFLELNFGLIYTPLLFLRTFFRSGSPIRSARVRKRIWRELWLIVVVWTVILSVVITFHLWKYYIWLYLAPAGIAANLQSWRKFIEHVGMTGSTPNTVTRSVVATSFGGRLMAFTLLHEPFHGVHHLHNGIPHEELPQHVAVLEPKTPDDRTPFPSYRHALWDLMRSLANPRVGTQWSVAEQAPPPSR